ncbi:hypothetical protein DMC25_17425 [Caulobacter sp. D4A]|uniref:hypothetical protein n=1 Tax=unclassified Caulobacter TaxID=2648921 RepID=UPI000D727352|nr:MULTISPECIES: hypothetical protein [unclassified Caulobacter]PXA83871.1 hypothetical protein DMC25_17425 [Caulobacter sp. D4A]PXA85123.1 hypothetical protein DMC18_23200 [Caulobacter sp. D5]
MVERDFWSWSVGCEACGTRGRVDLSEWDDPLAEPYGFRVDVVSPGFVVKHYGRTGLDTAIACASCGAVVRDVLGRPGETPQP